MGEHTHFTVVFERPEEYEDVHPQLCAEDHIIDYHDSRWEAFDGNLAQQRDELAEVVEAIEMAMRLPGVTAAEVLDWNSPIRAAIRAALAKYRQPQEEAPELFPGTMEKLRGLGKQK